MITYKKGNLLDTPDMLIAHGCNAQGVMGSGVAKAIRDKYPKAFDDYQQAVYDFKYPRNHLGRMISSAQPDGRIILNCVTQDQYGKDGKKYVSYDAIDTCMNKIQKGMFGLSTNVSMPKIGAGLGGGEWSIIEAIINHRLHDYNVTIWTLE